MFAIHYPTKEHLLPLLKQTPAYSVDLILLITGAFEPGERQGLFDYLAECERVLKKGGLLFVQGQPDYLPELGVYLDQRLTFKYWIAVESAVQDRGHGLPSAHAGILLFTKGHEGFNIYKVRFPHEYCAYCGKSLRDWGGKAHLMHPEGYAISDVWKSLPKADNYTGLSEAALRVIFKLAGVEKPEMEPSGHNAAAEFDLQRDVGKYGIVGPREGMLSNAKSIAEPGIQYRLPGFDLPKPVEHATGVEIEAGLYNVVHHGDALEILKQYPDNSIDLVFADPPYNLDKGYNVYADEHSREEYIAWCNAWLREYVRILKPTGSLYVLNLPRWSMYHAVFLNQHLYFQNWIVWDALSEPRGKLMPAHYGLLHYTKHPTDFTFNYETAGKIDARYYCLRPACIRKRKARGVDEKEALTDIWWDIHRIKHRRDRDYHPCQLPDELLERIILLSTHEGDVVLDALAGTGTTAIVAARLGRRYVAIDIDEYYVNIIREKIAQLETLGYIQRPSISKPKKRYTKKALQLELRDLAIKLGRLPTPDDVQKMSKYGLAAFYETFPTWGKALKAARLEVSNE
jgi:site-specific DNA-methyltransferase (adenine-specific)